MKKLCVAMLLLLLGQGISVACDEECAPGFVFDDAQGTCIRVSTS